MTDAPVTDRVVVETTSGQVAGAGGAVLSFKGLPFAAPPVGPLRWRRPTPPAAWTGVREALRFGDDPVQSRGPNLRGPRSSEDCLTLNVWAPRDPGAAPLPVLVWFPGGGYVAGAGSDRRFDGEALAALGAVVVTCNYRVGLFGFLAHPRLSAADDGASGNYGLYDKIAALEWIRDNIAAFGGDPGRVTAFGVSAGSASVALLLTAPGVRGLFHRAILQSAGAYRPLAPLADAEQAGLALGADIDALRALPTEEAFGLTGRLVPKQRGLTSARVLRPIRDGRLLFQDDRDAWTGGDFERMPLLVGNTADEGRMFTGNWTIRTPDAYRSFLAETFGEMAQEAERVYPAATEAEVTEQLAFLFGDSQFTYGGWGIAGAAARHGAPVWRYIFRRHPGGRAAEPEHGDDVPYVFGTLPALDAQPPHDEADADLSRRMMAAWLAFAASGDPGRGLGAWPVGDDSGDRHLAIDADCRPMAAWRGTQMRFLDRYYDSRS
ncbi:carboxylesterase/lipase family protein [Marinibaculum pumilum]|uniref:Carboxylesterase/lipase family protein n=1 Tax=Marinibaculum pumilum TaxID=1766165 RepID=A0ABV7L4B3_9PROT